MSKGLGKGLNALLDDSAAAAVSYGSSTTPEQVLPVSQLQASDVQPRHIFDDDALRSLSASIKSQGVIQPLLVRPLADGSGKYEIIAGERRWRASQLAGLTEVPVIIRALDDGKALEVAIVENVQRADLNPVDEAAGYLRLVNEFNYTHEDMARVTGKSRSHITNLLRLLALPDKIKDIVSKGMLTMGHARALLPLSEDESAQLRLANRIVKNNLSVRETEDAVRKILGTEKQSGKKRGRKPKDLATMELEKRLTDSLGLKANISQEEGVGQIIIHFDNKEEMMQLLTRLGG